MGKLLITTERYIIWKDETSGRYLGRERPHVVNTGDNRVFIQDITTDAEGAMGKGLERIGAKEIFKPGDRVAIKVNLGGGIHGVLPTYTDPELVRGVVVALRSLGCKPFICEADMRGHEITPSLLDVRGYMPLLTGMKVPFVNLSHVERVRFKISGIHRHIDIPLMLTKPSMKVISFAPPKHHWECGITCAQKNMYGAIADYKKSRFHRTYELIDHVIAAAARILRPDLSIIATKQLGAGLGPHFSIPFDFHRAIFARDMLSCDKLCAEILGYPEEKILYHRINAQGQPVTYTLLSGSVLVSEAALEKIKANRIPPRTVDLYKKTLFVQYFIPSILQVKTYHFFEFLLTWMNHKFYSPRGDPDHKAREPAKPRL